MQHNTNESKEQPILVKSNFYSHFYCEDKLVLIKEENNYVLYCNKGHKIIRRPDKTKILPSCVKCEREFTISCIVKKLEVNDIKFKYNVMTKRGELVYDLSLEINTGMGIDIVLMDYTPSYLFQWDNQVHETLEEFCEERHKNNIKDSKAIFYGYRVIKVGIDIFTQIDSFGEIIETLSSSINPLFLCYPEVHKNKDLDSLCKIAIGYCYSDKKYIMISVETQRELIEKYIKENTEYLVGEIYEEKGDELSNMKDRNELLNLFTELDDRIENKLVIYSPEIISWNVLRFAQIINAFYEAGLKVEIISFPDLPKRNNLDRDMYIKLLVESTKHYYQNLLKNKRINFNDTILNLGLIQVKSAGYISRYPTVYHEGVDFPIDLGYVYIDNLDEYDNGYGSKFLRQRLELIKQSETSSKNICIYQDYPNDDMRYQLRNLFRDYRNIDTLIVEHKELMPYKDRYNFKNITKGKIPQVISIKEERIEDLLSIDNIAENNTHELSKSLLIIDDSKTIKYKNQDNPRYETCHQFRLQRITGGKHEDCRFGRADIVTSTKLIEIKNIDKWHDVIGQLFNYGLDFYDRTKQLYLFGDLKDPKVKTIKLACRLHGIAYSDYRMTDDEILNAKVDLITSEDIREGINLGIPENVVYIEINVELRDFGKEKVEQLRKSFYESQVQYINELGKANSTIKRLNGQISLLNEDIYTLKDENYALKKQLAEQKLLYESLTYGRC